MPWERRFSQQTFSALGAMPLRDAEADVCTQTNSVPSNPADERFRHLLAFADEVLTVCEALGIDPFLDGSLAVKAVTQDPTITVHDIDLNCSEDDFPRLQRALEAAGIFCERQDWHVLQARRAGLKVEFGATDVWMQGIAGPDETLHLADRTVRMVNRKALWELYQRGFDATAASQQTA